MFARAPVPRRSQSVFSLLILPHPIIIEAAFLPSPLIEFPDHSGTPNPFSSTFRKDKIPLAFGPILQYHVSNISLPLTALLGLKHRSLPISPFARRETCFSRNFLLRSSLLSCPLPTYVSLSRFFLCFHRCNASDPPLVQRIKSGCLFFPHTPF